MTLEPLLSAPLAIQIHAPAAMGAFVLGIVQLTAPKGTLPHRTLGWIWVGLMTIVAVSAFFIHVKQTWGPFSWIHLIAIAVLIQLPFAVLKARRHEVRNHGRRMTGLFVGGLLIAGAATFLPGRIMHAIVFGATVPTSTSPVNRSS